MRHFLNREYAKGLIPLLQQYVDGKELQVKRPYEVWKNVEEVFVDDNLAMYRIKPSPQYRPWKPEEVPVGARIRSKDCNVNSLILCCEDGYIRAFDGTEDNRRWSLNEFFPRIEHSLDNGKTWAPCGVLVEE